MPSSAPAPSSSRDTVKEPLSLPTFKTIAARVGAAAGIDLPERKRRLVETRLSQRLRALGLSNYEAYVDHLIAAGEDEVVELVNCITTNVTGFFREPHHFDDLALFAKARLAAGRANLRVWSAGCSTGQEPYSIAMALALFAPGCEARITATDIDTGALARAREARYPPAALRGLPKAAEAYFEPFGTERRLIEQIRKSVVFRRFNLMDDISKAGHFDVVFCRNVCIYFDRPTQLRTFARLRDSVTDGGRLYIGHAETTGGKVPGLSLIGRTAYAVAHAHNHAHTSSLRIAPEEPAR